MGLALVPPRGQESASSNPAAKFPLPSFRPLLRISPMNQAQREALFDLLTLSIYADQHVSLTEEALLESAFIAEGWASEYPKSLFLEKSFARARAAAESEEAMAAYVAERARVFNDAGAKKEALGVVRNVLARDGLAAGEMSFLARLEAALPA
jgi:hypothetical protein